MPNLTYIGQTPTEGTGSPVIVLRHLRHLAARGWEITIIGEHGQDTSACERAGWTVQHLPLRRRWWPPFHSDKPLLRKLRTTLLARECRRATVAAPPDAIFGYLAAHADFSSEIAAHFARQTGRPLTLLVHDDAAAFGKDAAEKKVLRRRHAWILRQAHRCWFVSPELAREYDVDEEARRVLLPIPEGWEQPADWSPARALSPRVYYAGALWPPQFPLLAQIARTLHAAGTRLVILSRETPELRAFLASEPADGLNPFPGNRDALAHLVRDAAGLLVAYTATVAEMPWIATSFPSKFIEYSHLGLPCAVVAPTGSAFGRWAERNTFPAFFPPDRLDAFGRWAASLRDANRWRELAGIMRELARREFDCAEIQRKLEVNLIGADS